MSEKVDLLHRWLGIPPEEQPANHYRLLGASLFESSEEVIRHLAYQRKTALRLIEKGSEGAQVKALVQEIDRAAKCLLNAQAKAKYDEHLRIEIGDARQETAVPEAQTIKVSPKRKRKRRKPSFSGPVALVLKIVGGGIVGSIAAILLLWYVGGRDPILLFGPSGVQHGPISKRDGQWQRNLEADESRNRPQSDSTGTNGQGLTSDAGNVGRTPNNDEGADTGKDDTVGDDSSEGTQLTPVPNDKTGADARRDKKVPVVAALPSLRRGLIAQSYEQYPTQRPQHEYVHPSKFDQPVGDPVVVESLNPWGCGPKNAVALGYIRVDTPGVYIFHSYNYYDLNAVFLEGKVLCPFRGTVAGGTDPTQLPKDCTERVLLKRGFVRIAVVGYVACRGSVTLQWAREGDAAFSPIPPELLFHDPESDPKDFFGKEEEVVPPKIVVAQPPVVDPPPPNGLNEDKSAPTIPRLPVPKDHELTAALVLVQNVFKTDYENARTSEQLREFGRRLLQTGLDTQDDPAAQYVLLNEVISKASKAGDLETIQKAIATLEERYDFDPLETKVDAFSELVKTREYQAITTLANEISSEALRLDRYDITELVGRLMIRAVRPLRDAQISRSIAERNRELQTIARAFTKIKDDIATLEDNPGDESANTRVGRFYCFVKGQWKKGLPFLARSDDAELRKLAELHLLAPVRADPLVQLGDGWWAFAENEKGDQRERIRLHAVAVYKKALPHLSGISKARIETRINQLSADANSNGR